MKMTKNKYTKEQFVRDFLRMQALRNTKTECEEVEYNDSIEYAVGVEESVKTIVYKNNAVSENKSTKKEIDLTDAKEVYEIEVATQQSEKVIELNSIKSNTGGFDGCKTISIKDIKAAIEEESDLFESHKEMVFEIDIEYTSNDLSFNGLNLLEEKLKDGNLQIGFNVNVGTFIGDTTTKVVRKRKQKVKFEDVYTQLSFE